MQGEGLVGERGQQVVLRWLVGELDVGLGLVRAARVEAVPAEPTPVRAARDGQHARPRCSRDGTGRAAAASPRRARAGRHDLAQAAHGDGSVGRARAARTGDLGPPRALDRLRPLALPRGQQPERVAGVDRATRGGLVVQQQQQITPGDGLGRERPLPAGGSRHTLWGAEGSPPSAFDVVWPS